MEHKELNKELKDYFKRMEKQYHSKIISFELPSTCISYSAISKVRIFFEAEVKENISSLTTLLLNNYIKDLSVDVRYIL